MERKYSMDGGRDPRRDMYREEPRSRYGILDGQAEARRRAGILITLSLGALAIFGATHIPDVVNYGKKIACRINPAACVAKP